MTEPRTITMWSSSAPTGLVFVVICPSCRALVLKPDWSAHQRWHGEVVG